MILGLRAALERAPRGSALQRSPKRVPRPSNTPGTRCAPGPFGVTLSSGGREQEWRRGRYAPREPGVESEAAAAKATGCSRPMRPEANVRPWEQRGPLGTRQLGRVGERRAVSVQQREAGGAVEEAAEGGAKARRR